MTILTRKISETISENIAFRLNERGWTVYRLWKEVGGNKQRLYRACDGHHEPSAGLLRDIAESLDCTMDELVAA